MRKLLVFLSALLASSVGANEYTQVIARFTPCNVGSEAEFYCKARKTHRDPETSRHEFFTFECSGSENGYNVWSQQHGPAAGNPGTDWVSTTHGLAQDVRGATHTETYNHFSPYRTGHRYCARASAKWLWENSMIITTYPVTEHSPVWACTETTRGEDPGGPRNPF